MKRALKKGFTIVELVIVIAVIAILAAVLIPVFGSVIKKAEESVEQQRAHNQIKELLTLNNGQLPDGTFIYQTGDDGRVYAFEDNKIVQTGTESVIIKNQAYTVCVSASCITDESLRHTAETAITSIMSGVVEGCAAAELPFSETDGRFVVTLKSSDGSKIESGQVVYVNYYKEIKPDAVVFLFGDTGLALEEVDPSKVIEDPENPVDPVDPVDPVGLDDPTPEKIKVNINFKSDSSYTAQIIGTNAVQLTETAKEIEFNSNEMFEVMFSERGIRHVIVKINDVEMSFDESGNAYLDGNDKIVANYDKISSLKFYLDIDADIEIYAGENLPGSDEPDKPVDPDPEPENKIVLKLVSPSDTDSICVNGTYYYANINIELTKGETFSVDLGMLTFSHDVFLIKIGASEFRNIFDMPLQNEYFTREGNILTFSANITDDITIKVE